jgi:hypothetical protein
MVTTIKDLERTLARLTEVHGLATEGYFDAAVLDVHEPGLTATESLTVSTLRKAKGRVVSYGALAALGARDHASGGPDPKVASVRLCQIRKKRPDLKPHLQVVHSVGIRWAA